MQTYTGDATATVRLDASRALGSLSQLHQL